MKIAVVIVTLTTLSASVDEMDKGKDATELTVSNDLTHEHNFVL